MAKASAGACLHSTPSTKRSMQYQASITTRSSSTITLISNRYSSTYNLISTRKTTIPCSMSGYTVRAHLAVIMEDGSSSVRRVRRVVSMRWKQHWQ